MRAMLTTVLAGTLVSVLAAGASAAVIWEGSGSPALAGYGFDIAGYEGDFTFDSPPGFMHQNSGVWDVAHWTQDFGGGEMTRANGWFIQTRLEVISGTAGDSRGVFIRGGDDVGGVDLSLTPTLLTVIGETETHPLIAGEYHTIRVAMTAGGTSCDIYVDDMTTPVLSVPDNTAFLGAIFGDGSTKGGGEASWDYFYVNHAGGTEPTIPGDANGDNVVDDKDASILAAHWQQAGNWGDGDFNGDNVVNDQDASILAAHWGETKEGSTAPVPEPSVLVLFLGAGLIGLLARARRRR